MQLSWVSHPWSLPELCCSHACARSRTLADPHPDWWVDSMGDNNVFPVKKMGLNSLMLCYWSMWTPSCILELTDKETQKYSMLPANIWPATYRCYGFWLVVIPSRSMRGGKRKKRDKTGLSMRPHHCGLHIPVIRSFFSKSHQNTHVTAGTKSRRAPKPRCSTSRSLYKRSSGSKISGWNNLRRVQMFRSIPWGKHIITS